ncbi:MAG TPA: deoxyribonuclease IV [Mollicutes bacterium]|nr:deoxyribonuclease IV [Mollicutes bacterium]
MNLIIGSHVSFTKESQLLGSVKETISYGANTFMFYTGAPQNTKRDNIDPLVTKEAHEVMKQNNIDIKNVVVHAPYIINLANSLKPASYNFSISFLKQEIKRCEQLGIQKIIIHPGNHVGVGVDKGIQNIIDALNLIIEKDQSVYICLETMSGKGSECGSSFNELKKIIDGVEYNDKLLICLDTCHMHDAGYDMSNFEDVIKEFDKVIGLDKLGCIHINDSKNVRGSKKDRHTNIGFGYIGFDNFIKIIYHPLLTRIPKILETPYITKEEDDKKTFPPYKWEIKMIKDKKFNKDLIDHIRKP